MPAIPNLMDATVRLATQHGVGIGAHPGYKDLQGFGRRRINGTSDEIVNDIAYQVGALREFARRHGAKLQHVKPHGALYMELAGNEALSRSFIKLMRTVAPNAFVFCMGISETYRVAREAGQPVIREFYADRDYDSTRLDRVHAPCRQARSGCASPTRSFAPAWRARCERWTAPTSTSSSSRSASIPTRPAALEIASKMRAALIANGVRIAPVSEVFSQEPQAVEGCK